MIRKIYKKRYSIENRDQIFIKCHAFLFFTKNKTETQIKFKTTMIRLGLCVYRDA